MDGGSDRLPLNSFQLRDHHFTGWAVSGGPSVGRASCSNGTSPLIREASPAADVDRSYLIPMSHPSALCTDVGSVLDFVSCATSRTFLAAISGVYLLCCAAKAFRFVGDEQGELIEAPTVFHAVVFAGFRPTTCACRALAYARKRLDFDGAHALFLGMVHHLPGKLMV